MVRLIHEDMLPATRGYVEGGWDHILGGLKELLESAKVGAGTAISPGERIDRQPSSAAATDDLGLSKTVNPFVRRARSPRPGR